MLAEGILVELQLVLSPTTTCIAFCIEIYIMLVEGNFS
jgi:hypothetical protein